MGAMGAALLLRPDILTALRVLGLSVVRSVGEVDGDIDGFLRDEGADLTAEAQRHCTLGRPEAEVAEEPPRGPVGTSPAALSPGAVDGGALGGGSEQQIGGVAEGGGSEAAGEGALQEG